MFANVNIDMVMNIAINLGVNPPQISTQTNIE